MSDRSGRDIAIRHCPHKLVVFTNRHETNIRLLHYLRGLRYWSTTDKAWRVLITDAAALDGRNAKSQRPDFNPAELESALTQLSAELSTSVRNMNVYADRVENALKERLAELSD